jgi:hypothetical protein
VTVPGTALGDAAPDEEPVFVASVDGGETREFLTLQNAMCWMEDFERPTGSITFLGKTLVSYSRGDINAASASDQA